jgi:hypothetical protein
MILTLVIIVTTQIFNSSTMYSLITQTTVEEEKAKRIALGGVQVAMSQLFTGTEQNDESQIKLLARTVPSINRWQRFPLTEEQEGIDGQLELCIICEQGKLNINTVYDFSKKKFIDEDKPNGGMKTIAEQFFKGMKEYTGKDLFPVFEKLLKNRGYPFNDVTELFSSPEFSLFKNTIFYEPPTAGLKGKRPVYLTDLFTVDTSSIRMQPWLFSDSVCAVLGLSRAGDGEIKKRAEEIQGMIKTVKVAADWKTDWDKFLKPLYGKDFTSLPKNIDSVFDSQFAPLTFSVLSYGKVGKIIQRMLVIVEKHSVKKGSSASPFIIKKMYWI